MGEGKGDLPGDLTFGFKLWLDRGGKAFGQGPLRLLQLVRERGSLRQAAGEMSMSYNKAWHLLRNLEGRLGLPLIERSVGGVSGGGSRLTPQAEALVDRYGAMHREAEEAMTALFARHFGRAAVSGSAGSGVPEADGDGGCPPSLQVGS